jgi:hypothetical protein
MRNIYADFNDIAADGTLRLSCSGSLESIRQLSKPLTDGEEVWLTDGELRARARVFHIGAYWEGRSEWKFVRLD